MRQIALRARLAACRTSARGRRAAGACDCSTCVPQASCPPLEAHRALKRLVCSREHLEQGTKPQRVRRPRRHAAAQGLAGALVNLEERKEMVDVLDQAVVGVEVVGVTAKVPMAHAPHPHY